ncbi:hydroxyacylglutathione hydrolase [Hasllibacter halocynthiae]|uniref:Hydroxyacylglutathione hydrolase n=1 Tax=Hasllibacter halocynthiae TaxID=595589 RepID=A0A2T0X7R6_9RHOB|nr:MBL fold metallo-hydrolase [Hasllibacter halocynthiae]PRY94967.1 hydroxyacylglutathione hydrolase [Hasllibacter halocynthiae]
MDPSDDLAPGRAVRLSPLVRRVVAPNPSPLTGPGTNGYVVGTGAVALVDPGPDDPRHRRALLAALGPGERIAAILVTHAHLDHSASAPALAAETGAPVLAFGPPEAGRPAGPALAALGGGEGLDAAFRPDRTLGDGEVVETGGARIAALHTPGHFGGHLAFAAGPDLLCGDLILGWATTLISPPDGDLERFRASCARVRSAGFSRLLPGHGDPVEDPAARIDAVLAHRALRDRQIAAALRARPGTAHDLAERLYDVPAPLMPAAARNVLAHLLDQTRQGRARPDGPLSEGAIFHPLAPAPPPG